MADPTLRFYNRQTVHRPNLPWLRRVVKAALPSCMEALVSSTAPLAELAEVEITIVSDTDIALIHGEFMNDPTPTDVITFHHGEILVSADTALRQGSEHGESLDRELALYMIHGLLHLAGWDDHEPREAALMAERQAGILAQVAPAEG
jgi:probable rRNA maturation factor